MSVKSNKALDLGISLIALGVIIALIKVGVISWNVFNSLLVLWPLILVIAGLGILFKNNLVVKTLSWVLFFGIIIAHAYITDGVESVSDYSISLEKEEGIERGLLNLDMGGSRIKISSQTEKLLEASLQSKKIKYSVNGSKEKPEILFTNDGVKIVNVDSSGKLDNANRFLLNKDIVWELDLDTGAVDGDFDLSDIIVEKISIDAGAANLKFKLGDKSEEVQIFIDAGLSNIEFEVPDTVGVRTKIDAGLSGSSFNKPGWIKKDGYYYSEGYDDSDVKVDMDIDIGLGNINVVFN